MRIAMGVVLLGLMIPAVATGQDSEQITRLAGLGQVWGFLKYYHPGVAGGTIDWDSVVVAAVPAVRASRSVQQYHALIQRLIDAAGPTRPCECDGPGIDSVRLNLDLRWQNDRSLFSPELSRQLERITPERHTGTSRYVSYGVTAMFNADTGFARPEYPDEAARLLSLFRFWNAIHYFFPYKYVNDGDWNEVLREFIPRMIAARDAAEYHFAVLELTTRVRDTHVGASSTVLSAALGRRFPAFQAKVIDEKIVVWQPVEGSGLRRGDVITHIDGEPVDVLWRKLSPYVAAGNPATHDRKLLGLVLRAHGDSATYTIDRGGSATPVRVAMAVPPTSPDLPAYPVTQLARVLEGNIGYINMGDINRGQVDSAMAIVANTAGLVIDVRNYPRGTMHQFTAQLSPEPRPFVKFTRVDTTFPGQFTWSPPVYTGPRENPNHYRGRIAILIDERTQSHAEFSVMALRTVPENQVIGSQTAGADGNVTYLSLPGGIRTVFTGLGVYYPDGTPTQRVGIVPDIEVRPTLAGARAGRDEVLERAIDYVLKRR